MHEVKIHTQKLQASTVESVQDFLIKLGIKPRMHLWEISIFCQTYQNYEQSRQKLGIFLENKVL